MLLSNTMEDMQLDFNRPLLSVRRFSSMMTTFEYEERKTSDNSQSKVPPLPVYKSDLKSGPVRRSGTVPFKWEHSPGQPKDENKSQAYILGSPPTAAQKLPPARVSSSEKGLDANVKDQYESSNGEMEETGCSGSEDTDDAFIDALDALSRTESFYLNCSTSGVSGLEGPNIIPSRNLSADQQAWDFMMGRFLPAAKAMASETPPYSTRKPPTALEQLKNKHNAVQQLYKQLPVSSFSSKNFEPHEPDSELGKSEDDLSGPEDLSTKACGLLPQFLLKSSLCLLNPVPGMKMQNRKPISVRRVRIKSSNIKTLCSETDYEHVSAFKKGTTGQLQTKEHNVDKSKLYSKPSQISVRGDSRKQDDISAHPRGHCNSTHQGKGFLMVSEKLRNCRANEEKSNSFGKSISTAPVVEKTIYIDSVGEVRSPDTIKLMDLRQDSGIEESRKTIETTVIDSSVKVIKDLNLNSDKVELQAKNVESMDSCFLFSLCKSTHDHELQQMDGANDSRRDCKLIQDSSISTCPKLAENEKIDLKRQLLIGLNNKANADEFGRKIEAEHVRIERGSKFHRKSSNQETSNDSCSQPPLALPLPLPKSPSESWLVRALPVVISKNSSSRSSLWTQNYSTSEASKWENGGGMYNGRHGHSQFSELLGPILED